MTILTGVPVHIRRGDKCVVEADTWPYSQIGKLYPGRQYGSGKQFCRRYLPDADGNRPLPARRMESFFPGAIDSQILNALAELFLPSDKEIQIRYIIQQEDARFRLGTPDEQGAYLGISTYL